MRARLGAMVLVMMLAASLFSAAANPGVPPAHARAPAGPGPHTPTGGLEVALTPRSASLAPGEAAAADLTIYPQVEVAEFQVSLRATGNVQMDGPAALTLPGAPAGGAAAATLRYRVTGPGRGELWATVTAVTATGRPLPARAALLDILATDEGVFQGANGALELQLAALDRRRALGKLSPEQHAENQALILGGGATTAIALGPAGAGPSQATDITVEGFIQWTDSAGNTHPVRKATVEVWDDDRVVDDLLATRTTDDRGWFTATVPNDTGEGGQDIFLRVKAEGPGFRVLSGRREVHRFDSALQPDVADGTHLIFHVTALNAADNHTAFSVHQAMVLGSEYVESVHGARLPDINVYFPSSCFGASCYFLGINIKKLDRFDWDVILHELGHYVADELNIENQPIGSHSITDNLGEGFFGKGWGIRLAWGEGWATYFGTVAQQGRGAALGVPNVGDDQYQDTEDANFAYSLETGGFWRGSGEDNELSVSLIMWDLYDAADDSGDTGVALGDGTLWTLMDNADPTALSAAYQVVINGRPRPEVVAVGCIMSEHAVAPAPLTPADGFVLPGVTPPQFTWEANGGGPSHRNDQFTVGFFDDALATSLWTTPQLAVTRFTPTQAQWDAILDAELPGIRWLVVGSQTDRPATGPYTGCSFRLEMPTPTGLSVTPASVTLGVGATQQLAATAAYSDGSVRDVTQKAAWTSTDTAVATVDAAGRVTAVGAGTATIRAEYRGQAATATVTVPAAATSKLDLVFLVDTTGSMWDDIDSVKAAAEAVVQAVSAAVPDYRVALADYKDFPYYPYGSYGDYPYRAMLPFSADTGTITGAIRLLGASGGADWPESAYTALMKAIGTENLGSWRPDAARVILIMSDAPPHDPEPFTGYTLATVEAAGNVGVAAAAEPAGDGAGTLAMAAEATSTAPSATAMPGVRIFSVVVGGDQTAYGYFSQLSEQTGGAVFRAPTASQVVQAILDAIGAIGDPGGNRPPDVTGAAPSVPSIWSANHEMVAVQILHATDPDGDPVTITVTRITQDEPVSGEGSGQTAPDGAGIGTDTAWVRAERAGPETDRVYRIWFTAADGRGGSSQGSVLVCVPHDQGPNATCTDDGQLYDSTQP